jgi:hypothetical protein
MRQLLNRLRRALAAWLEPGSVEEFWDRQW